MNSKTKGARYEREIANALKERGYDVRRSAQYCGNTGEAADVIGLNGIHIECKHYKTMAFSYDWMEQAVRDHKPGTLPAVFHRTNAHESLVTMRLDDWLTLYSDTTFADK